MILRDYQQRLVTEVRANYLGNRSVLAVAPTGSGKTVCFAYITQHAAAKGNTVWILAHRVELVDQISRTLKEFLVPHGFIAAGYEERLQEKVQVCSVFTLARRLDRLTPPALIIVDECHHAVKSTTWGKVLAAFPTAKVLGVTATPVRLSGEGLGECFTSMVLGPTTADLIQAGALCPFRVFAPPTIQTSGLRTRAGEFVAEDLRVAADNGMVTGDAVAHYRRLALGRRAVAFCVSVQHAEHVAAEFNAAGIPSRSVDGGLDRELRRAIIAAFVRGDIEVLTSCDLVSEGFDVPAVEVAISLRPTQSEGLWLQQCGRILRPSPGKTEALIIDHAGNCFRHGLPDDDRPWSLEGCDRRGQKATVLGVRVCSQCFAATRSGTALCASCGAAFPARPREVEVAAGELEEVDQVALRAKRKQEEQGARDFDGLVLLATQRGYKNPAGWATHVLAGRAKARERYRAPALEEQAYG